MLFLAQIAYNKMYQTTTKSKKQNVNNAPKVKGNYVYKPYRTLNNY